MVKDKSKSRILIVQTAFLGDLLLAAPMLKSIRKKYPQAQIYLLCRKGLGAFVQQLGLVDVFFEIQKKDSKSYQAAYQQIAELDFSIVFCPHESLTSALFVRKIRAEKKIAFRKWWNFLFFDTLVVRDSELPEALRQLSLVEPLDDSLGSHLQSFKQQQNNFLQMQSSAAQSSALTVLTPVPDWARADINEKILGTYSPKNLPEKGNFICLFPGSVWATKQWTEKGFLQLAEKIKNQLKLDVVWMGSAVEKELCARLSQSLPGSISLAGETNLLQTMLVLAHAKLVVCNDSGGQHMAALLSKPTVSIFGPTVVRYGYRPWNSNSVIVENINIKCRPCGKHGHQKCPIGTHECMTSISADQVFEACRQMLFNSSNQ